MLRMCTACGDPGLHILGLDLLGALGDNAAAGGAQPAVETAPVPVPSLHTHHGHLRAVVCEIILWDFILNILK